MVRRYQRVAPSLSDSLQKLLYKPNRFSAFKDVRDGDRAVSFCHTAECEIQIFKVFPSWNY